MKMFHLQQIESSIPKLINIPLPIKIAYKLNILLDEVETHLSRLQQFKLDFFNKHGERLEDNKFRIPRSKVEEFDEGMRELLYEDLDIKPIEIPLSLLIDTDLKLTILEIDSLKNAGFLIDDINNKE